MTVVAYLTQLQTQRPPVILAATKATKTTMMMMMMMTNHSFTCAWTSQLPYLLTKKFVLDQPRLWPNPNSKDNKTNHLVENCPPRPNHLLLPVTSADMLCYHHLKMPPVLA